MRISICVMNEQIYKHVISYNDVSFLKLERTDYISRAKKYIIFCNIIDSLYCKNHQTNDLLQLNLKARFNLKGFTRSILIKQNQYQILIHIKFAFQGH